ncbi:hypothetical protein AtNW77_Chr4g0272571 [Arabidopsis thaliana]
MIMLMMMETWDVEAPVAHDFVSVTHGPIILKVKENSQCSWRVVRDGW